MKLIKSLALPLALLCAVSAWAKKDNDPVLMTIGGNDVRLSEFEYLYNKNSQQQLEQESLDQYLDRFVTYKLKVEDARAAGIDTTQAFCDEYATYRRDLAAPYLQDTTVTEQLARQAWERMDTEVDLSHIMLPPVPEYDYPVAYAKLDSIRQCVLRGEDFGDLAVKYSVDRSAKRNRGHLGYLTVGRTPYGFEDAAYNTPVGEMTIARSEVGVHLIKVLGTRPAQGEVLVEHILKLYPRNATDEMKAAVAAQMDSIYGVVMSGADFEDLARRESQDPGSAQKGGQLPWFGTGMMVPEFERIAFDLAKDSISHPFATQYGVHIVKKIDSRGRGSYASSRAGIVQMMQRDNRANMPRQAKVEQLKAEYNLKENNQFLEQVKAQAAGKYDSTTVARLQGTVAGTAFTFADQTVTAQEVLSAMDPTLPITEGNTAGYVQSLMTAMEADRLLEYETEKLSEKYPEYRNLLNEYYDGMMLFEISNRNVWDRANRDTEGLEAFFERNRAKYAWDEPRYKGYVIYTASDSLRGEIERMIPTLERDSLFQKLRSHFKRDIRIEYQLARKGENRVVDNLCFGGDSVTEGLRLPVYFAFEGKTIDQPEEAADVRGEVTADYQNELEEQWVAQLRQKYKVKINKKTLKKLNK